MTSTRPPADSRNRPDRSNESRPIVTTACARLRAVAGSSRRGPAGIIRPLPKPASPSMAMIDRSLASEGF